MNPEELITETKNPRYHSTCCIKKCSPLVPSSAMSFMEISAECGPAAFSSYKHQSGRNQIKAGQINRHFDNGKQPFGLTGRQTEL